jgi:hypothetical protein
MKEELYRKVYIKSEADLPKETGMYIVTFKDGRSKDLWYQPNTTIALNDDYWITEVDSYFYPIDREQIEQKEIKTYTSSIRDDMYRFHAVLQSHCNIRKESFSHNQFNAAWNAVKEYTSQQPKEEEKPTDAEIEKWAIEFMSNESFYATHPDEKFTAEWHGLKNALARGAKAMRDNPEQFKK